MRNLQTLPKNDQLGTSRAHLGHRSELAMLLSAEIVELEMLSPEATSGADTRPQPTPRATASPNAPDDQPPSQPPGCLAAATPPPGRPAAATKHQRTRASAATT